MSLGSYFANSRFFMKAAGKKIARKGRRRPVQGRSQATVDALLAAAAQILARHGPDAATTNAIAERAGVSIGSLYQYFADKEALIDALAELHVAEMTEVLAGALAGAGEGTLTEEAGRIVAAIVAAHRVDPRLHHALHQVLPRARMSAIDRLEDTVMTQVSALLQAREGLTAAGAGRTALVLVRALGGLVRTTIRRDPEWFADPALARVMTRMIVDCVTAAREA